MQRADFAAGLHRAGIDSLPALLAHEILPLGVLHAAALQGDVHTLWHPRLSDRAARAFFLGRSATLPPTATAAAAEVGASHSLLHAWIAREGGLSPDARRDVVNQLCGNVQARGVRGRPRELAAHRARLSGAGQRPSIASRRSSKPVIEKLATLFGDDAPGPVNPDQVISWTERLREPLLPWNTLPPRGARRHLARMSHRGMRERAEEGGSPPR